MYIYIYDIWGSLFNVDHLPRVNGVGDEIDLETPQLDFFLEIVTLLNVGTFFW